ncbi:hypothetical protein M0811_07452 [Anaeramoeba ignava]|uniref:Uncharacterized protein n=1 Tax=Anaeramoeba ignava TaxID=1746090 RepID=A0A9Q0LM85_ANAIG|nr:hypothetical protein M0811_07452 [Anaeramoeba ignava]
MISNLSFENSVLNYFITGNAKFQVFLQFKDNQIFCFLEMNEKGITIHNEKLKENFNYKELQIFLSTEEQNLFRLDISQDKCFLFYTRNETQRSEIFTTFLMYKKYPNIDIIDYNFQIDGTILNENQEINCLSARFFTKETVKFLVNLLNFGKYNKKQVELNIEKKYFSIYLDNNKKIYNWDSMICALGSTNSDYFTIFFKDGNNIRIGCDSNQNQIYKLIIKTLNFFHENYFQNDSSNPLIETTSQQKFYQQKENKLHEVVIKPQSLIESQQNEQELIENFQDLDLEDIFEFLPIQPIFLQEQFRFIPKQAFFNVEIIIDPITMERIDHKITFTKTTIIIFKPHFQFSIHNIDSQVSFFQFSNLKFPLFKLATSESKSYILQFKDRNQISLFLDLLQLLKNYQKQIQEKLLQFYPTIITYKNHLYHGTIVFGEYSVSFVFPKHIKRISLQQKVKIFSFKDNKSTKKIVFPKDEIIFFLQDESNSKFFENLTEKSKQIIPSKENVNFPVFIDKKHEGTVKISQGQIFVNYDNLDKRYAEHIQHDTQISINFKNNLICGISFRNTEIKQFLFLNFDDITLFLNRISQIQAIQKTQKTLELTTEFSTDDETQKILNQNLIKN